MNSISLMLFISLLSITVNAQEANNTPWEVIDETEEFSVWFRKIENTEIKELKIRFVSPAEAHQWISEIRNVEDMPTWSHTCRTTNILKRDPDNTLYFYYVADIPWPIRGRDVILQMHSFVDSLTGNSIITSNNYDGLLPENEDYTRVDYMRGRWEFIKLDNGKTQIDYFISTEISNSFPDWLVEKAITYSPLKSIDALREIVE